MQTWRLLQCWSWDARWVVEVVVVVVVVIEDGVGAGGGGGGGGGGGVEGVEGR